MSAWSPWPVVWLALLGLLAGCQPAPESGDEERVVVYTSRQPHLIEPLFERYTELTGVAVQFTSDSEAALIERLAAEGARTPADLLITVDAGNLWQATERELLSAIQSPVLEATVPAALRDEAGHWFGLSIRARTMVYHPDRVQPDELSTFEALAEPQWRGRLCLRSSRKVYNQSLIAMLIEHHGEAEAERIVAGWVANLATNPYSSDTQAIEAVAAGQCDVAIVNSYYLGRLVAANPDYPVRVFWANQHSQGVHVNISGAGVTRHARHPAQAQALLEWLASPEAQATFAFSNFEYPVDAQVPLEGVLAQWGSFRADDTPLAVTGQRQAQAVRLADRVGYR